MPLRAAALLMTTLMLAACSTMGTTPARSPVHATATAGTVPLNPQLSIDLYTVPSGKRLVIEHVAVATGDAAASQRIFAEIFTRLGGLGVWHPLGFLERRPDIGWQILSRSLRLYADPESGVAVMVRTQDHDASMGFRATFSGYLVDAD